MPYSKNRKKVFTLMQVLTLYDNQGLLNAKFLDELQNKRIEIKTCFYLS